MIQQRGFTLIELITVMMIVGILAAVAGPKFIGRDVFESRGAQSVLTSALQYAQKTAVAQRRTVYLKLDTSTRVLCLGYVSDCSNAVIDPVTKQPFTKTLSNAVSIVASQTTLGFDGLGRPTPNLTATYQLQNTVDTSQPVRIVTVEAETGYVR
jgi:MSHA pilin protein MshC